MPDVIIIGAGLAGLTCARQLAEANVDFQIFEATDRVGGRVRTDVVDGFTLDHGFQVLLSAYPACQRWLDYDSLRLRSFDPGALVRIGGKFHTLGDPWRKPTQALATALAPVGSLGDKLRVGKLRWQARTGSLDDLYNRPAQTSQQRLRELGFSEAMIDHFFRPFLGGVFLENQLSTSSRMLEFVFRMFASGPITIPADGMAAIPRQLAERLPRGSIRLETSVDSISGNTVRTSDGQSHPAKQIVLATESTAVDQLWGNANGSIDRPWNQTLCLYFAAEHPPRDEKMLMLRGDETEGAINNLVVLSNVAKEYAPTGTALISVSVTPETLQQSSPTDAEVSERVLGQLRGWFGNAVDRWRHLRTYHVPYALPSQSPEQLEPTIRTVQPFGTDGPVVCGDHRETSSIQGAMNSGQRAAEAIIDRLAHLIV